MKFNVILALLCLQAVVVVASPMIVATETGMTGDTGPHNIGGFELYGTPNFSGSRLYWWSGRGSCAAEFRSYGKIGYLDAVGGTAARPVGDCTIHHAFGDPRAVARDNDWVYFADSSGVRRQALGAVPGDDTQPLAAANGLQLGGLTLANGRLFWTDYDGTTCRVRSMNPDGTGLITVFSGNFPKITRLVLGSYRIGVLFRFDTLFMLHSDGRLRRLDYTTPGAVPSLLAAGVSDFAVRDESSGIGQFRDFFTSVYAVVNEAQLVSIRADTAQATSIKDAPTASRMVAVTLDDQNAYIVEQPVLCSGFCVFTSYVIRRQLRPSDDRNNGRPWTAIQIGPSSDLRAFNLRSDGRWLHWCVGPTIMRLPTDAPPLELEFAAQGLEVVQTTQDMANRVPLVQGKATYVRAYATATANTTGLPLFYPSGILRVYREGTPPVLVGTLSPQRGGLVDSAADWNILRGDLKRSFLFKVTNDWVRAGTMRFVFTVNPNGSLPETGNEPNDTFSIVTVRRGGNPKLFLRPIYTEAPDYNPAKPGSCFVETIERAKAMLPVENFEVNWSPHAIARPVTLYHFDKVCFIFCWYPITEIHTYEPFYLRSGLSEWMEALVAVQKETVLLSGPPSDKHLIGAVSASIQGNISYVADKIWPASVVRMENLAPQVWNRPVGGVDIAHALGRNYRRRHVACATVTDVDVNYPYPSCQITPLNAAPQDVQWGFDPITLSLINPTTTADLMSEAATRWPSAYTWQNIGSLFASGGGAPAEDAGAAVAAALNELVLLLQGVVDTELSAVALGPFSHLPAGFIADYEVSASLNAAAVATGTPYLIRFLNTAGAVLGTTPLVVNAENVGSHQGFLQIARAPLGTKRVQIVNGGSVRAERFVSASNPTLSLAAPVFNATERTLSLSWMAGDADGDSLLFLLQYSPDNGGTWIPLRTSYSALSVNLDASFLPGGSQAVLRVVATDGFNTAVATTAPFAMPRRGPTPLIEGVQPNQQLPFGAHGSLLGLALDGEDGSVADNRLNWTLAGPTSLAAPGGPLALAGLSPGNYTATLSATDSDDQSGSTALNFSVGPLIVPEGPAPVLDGLCADLGYVNAPVVPIILPDGGMACARFVHSGNALYVCFTDLHYRGVLSGQADVGLVVDTNNDRSQLVQPSDYGFYITDSGVPYQTEANVVTLNPRPGFTAVVMRGEQGWNAELRIDDTLVGGWNHGVGLSIRHLGLHPSQPGSSRCGLPPKRDVRSCRADGYPSLSGRELAGNR